MMKKFILMVILTAIYVGNVKAKPYNHTFQLTREHLVEKGRDRDYYHYEKREEKKPRKIELSLFCSLMGGKESPPLGVTQAGKEMKVEIGGGYSIGVGCKIPLAPSLKLYSNFGYACGELNVDVAGAEASFTRYPLKIGIVYETELKEKRRIFFYGGGGVGIYFSPVFKSEIYYADLISTVSWELNYKRALGFDGMAGVKWVDPRKTWFVYCELQGSSVKYSLDKSVIRSVGLWIVKPGIAWNELDGGGIGLILGIGTLF